MGGWVGGWVGMYVCIDIYIYMYICIYVYIYMYLSMREHTLHTSLPEGAVVTPKTQPQTVKPMAPKIESP